MSDPDTVAWVDAAGTAHSPLNMPALDAPQRTIVLQIRDYFDMDAHALSKYRIAFIGI